MSETRDLLKKTFGIEPAKKATAIAPIAPPSPSPTPEPEVKQGVSDDAMAAVQAMVWKDGPLPPTQSPAPMGGTPPPPGGSGPGTVGALNPSKGWGQV